jgi:sensor histidine kinase YesM
MKKLLLLIVLLIGILALPHLDGTKNYGYFLFNYRFIDHSDTLKNPEVVKWEYLKTRLFMHGSSVVAKFKGPILITLEDASPTYKQAVAESLEEIRNIIPNKTIDFYESYTGYDAQTVIERVADSSKYNNMFNLYTRSIQLSFKEEPEVFGGYIRPTGSLVDLNTSILKDSTVIKRTETPITPTDEIKGAIVYFNFSDSITYTETKKYIKYELLRSLCYLVDNSPLKNTRRPNDERKFSMRFYSYPNASGVFSNEIYKPEDHHLNEYDRFLLQKLYSDHFLSEFKQYLKKYYPWRYRMNFLHKDLVNSITQVVVVLLGILIFVLSLLVLHKRRLRFSILEYFLPLSIFGISFVALFQLKRYLTFESFVTGTYIFKFLGIVFLISLTQALVLWFVEKFFVKFTNSFVLKLILKVAFTFACYLILYVAFDANGTLYLHHMLLIATIVALARGLYLYLNHYSESIIRKKDLELSQLKELQLATELNSLHAQINPHFLYNALNSIASLAKSDGTKTEKMALTLSDLFRYSVNRKGEKMASIKEEVDMVESYLQIEKIRFEDRLEYNIQVEPSIEHIQIPRFVLQPLIENAIKHGVARIEHQGKIELEITSQKNKLSIVVSDNGPEFPDGLVSGHGLQSVFDLLRLSYGEQASMNWENLPKKKITIIIHSNS